MHLVKILYYILYSTCIIDLRSIDAHLSCCVKAFPSVTREVWFYFFVFNKAVVSLIVEEVTENVAHHILTIYQTLTYSLFGLQEEICQLFELHTTLDVQEDANGCVRRAKEGESEEKDCNAILASKYANDKREMVTYLAYLPVSPLLGFGSVFLSVAHYCSDHTVCMTSMFHRSAPPCLPIYKRA